MPIAFEVRERLEVREGGAGPQLVVHRVDPTWIKDYDVPPGDEPVSWPARFDVSQWGILSAWANGERIGGAVIVTGPAEIDMLEGRADLALLWDLRVSPAWRGRGAGTGLFKAVEAWALARDATELKVETQTVNVPACRFYARQGCTLLTINRSAYPAFPDEIQLLWYKKLANP